MRDFSRRSVLGAFAAPIAAATLAAPARAQAYPTRPVRLVVGFAAGGGNDIFARLVGAKLSEIFGQPVVIENRPGAGGRLAAEYVSNQQADGYLGDHVAATFHMAHFFRLISQPTPGA